MRNSLKVTMDKHNRRINNNLSQVLVCRLLLLSSDHLHPCLGFPEKNKKLKPILVSHIKFYEMIKYRANQNFFFHDSVFITCEYELGLVIDLKTHSHVSVTFRAKIIQRRIQIINPAFGMYTTEKLSICFENQLKEMNQLCFVPLGRNKNNFISKEVYLNLQVSYPFSFLYPLQEQ